MGDKGDSLCGSAFFHSKHSKLGKNSDSEWVSYTYSISGTYANCGGPISKKGLKR